jgi:poly(A) polymerase/tRNA nucleotidyltransferase (CCA-adding enzyme)
VTGQPALCIDPPAFLADPVLAPVLAALPEARIAGGAVRDTLAGRPVADIDLATPLPPGEVIRALTAAGIRTVPTGIGHGTVTAVSGGRGFEITTLRRDERTDGRHAVVAFTDDWQEDAARRDFTMNALSMTRDGAIYDYFGGIADLRAGIVRFVGDPATRIAEDYLRILRFFRFHARYAAGPPDQGAIPAIRAGVPGLARLSAERVWSELARILTAPDPTEAIGLMAELGVLAAIIPEGADPARLTRAVAAGAPPDPILRTAALLTGDPLSFAERLRLSTAERDRLMALRQAPLATPGANDAALRRLLADTDPAVLHDRTWLTGETSPAWPALRARLAAMPRPVFPLEGRDVLALGMAPGPAVGTLLRAVRQWWLDGGCSAGTAACRAELARLIAAEAPPDDPAGRVPDESTGNGPDEPGRNG